jgi:2-phosphoglycerate kinase
MARHFNAGLTLVDDIRLALQAVTTPAQLPDLHYFTEAVKHNHYNIIPPPEFVEGLIKVGRGISPGLEIIVSHHLNLKIPLVLEGDGLTPEFAGLARFGGIPADGLVRSVFIYEPEETELYRNMQKRGRGFNEMSETTRQRDVKASWLYGRWLLEEATRFGLPVLETRPQETLLERIIGTVNT